MANNRMVLICNACHPADKEGSYFDKGKYDSGTLVIGKWYPGGSYSMIGYNRDTDGKVDQFLEDHGHVGTEYEEYPVRLEYETPKEVKQ